jgi:WD40 repeat protein/tetratricopeptide (TPR) repeat protein
MIDDPRVDRLLEQLLESGGSPEEACRSCPELLEQVRAGLLRLRLLEQEVGVLFPPSDPPGEVGLAAPPTGELPQIPGYEVEAELGRGGVGVVYRARHLRLNRPVALKMLLAGAFATRAERQRFAREAELVAGLRHPNLVQIYDVGDLDGRSYFTMEFLEGGSLADTIAGTPRPARQAAELVETLADVIAAAHRGGVVHRDLKPSNVLLTADGTSKVTDFGLARRLEVGSSLTQTGSPVGTPSYMAPEQARGRASEVGPATDLYALGAVFYELLTGRPPFRAESSAETLYQVVTQDPVPPSRLNARVPRDLETICLKCLEKEPARRYASAADLADDLRRALNGEPIRARPVALWEKGWKWTRRRPAIAAMVAAVHLLLAALLGLGLWSYSSIVRALETANLATKRADAEKLWSQRMSAGLALDRGLIDSQQGKIASGLLWMAESLAVAPPEDPAFAGVVQQNLAAWRAPLTIPRIMVGHDAIIEGVSLSPDGRSFVSSGRDGAARRWDAATGQPIGGPLRHSAPGTRIGAVAFDPTGRWIATGSDDQTTRIWDATTGEPVGDPVRHPDAVNALAFTPDGQALLVGTGVRAYPVPSSARLVEVPSGRFLTPSLRHAGSIRGVAVTPDGRTLLTGAMDKTVRFWEAATGDPLGNPLPMPGEVKSLAISADGRMLAVGCNNGEALIFSLPDRRQVGPALPHPSEVFAIAFHPDGAILATGSMDSNARLWDLATRRILDAPSYSIPLGRMSAWDLTSRRLLGAPLVHHNYVWSLTFSRDGLHLLTGSEDKFARLWDLSLAPTAGIPLTRIDQDLDLLALESQPVTPRYKAVITGNQGRPVPPWVREYLAASFSPDGRLVVVGCVDSTARILEVATGREVVTPLRHDNWVRAVAFGPDNRRVLTGSHDMTARLWDATTGEPLTPPLRHSGEVLAVAISPDGRKGLTASADATAQLWDLGTGRRFGPPMPNAAPVTSAVFSRDGARVLIAGDSGEARVWDAATATPLGPPLRHGTPLVAARFDDDDRGVRTLGRDGLQRLWPAVPPLAGSPERLILWAQVVSVAELDSDKAVSVLEQPAWLERRGALIGTPLMANLQPDADRVLAWHDSRVGAYEWDGPGEGALWHLDRLAAARPRDGLVRARRAGVLHRLGRDEEARKALQEARDLGGIAVISDWCRARAASYDRGGRPADALWWRQWLAGQVPDDPAAWAELAHSLAKAGRFAEAAGWFDRAVALAPDRLDFRRGSALARLGAGDRDRYRQRCAALLARARASSDSGEAALVVEACILTPDSVGDWPSVLELARRAADGYEGYRWLVMVALYRSGRIRAALDSFRVSEKAPTFDASGWLIRGMIEWRAGEREIARKTWDRPYRLMVHLDRGIAREQVAKTWWSDWPYYVACHALRREAEAMLAEPAGSH